MPQLLLILTLVLNLLACPLRCSVCEAGTSASVTEVGQAARAHCGCCPNALPSEASGPETAESRGSSGTKTPTGEECTCPDCLCGGAILSECLDLSDGPLLAIEWLPALCDGNLSLASERLESRQRFPVDASAGRSTLVQYQRWLI